mgnify:CR=1 FL=1
MQYAALYIRVSTEEQRVHGLSVEAQCAALDEWAGQSGYAVVDHYIDNGISARKPASKRPALQRLLEDVQAGKVDLIVFTKLDRWFRNVGEYYKVQDVLDQHKVAWKAIHEDYETATAAGRLKVNIMLSVAQDEADRTGERIKRVFELKRAKGEPVSGHVPTGYKIEGKTIIKDPATEEAISAYFQQYLSTGSISVAIDYVAEQYGLHLKYALASRILSKSAYWGDFNGIPCPPYITKEQGQRIASMRRRTSRKTQENRVYLFSGLLACGECGARMGGRAHKFGSVEKAEYYCPGHYQKKGCGNRTNIRESAIEDYLISTIMARFQTYRAFSFSGAEEKKINFGAEIAKLKRKLANLKELYLNDFLTLEEYRQDYQPLMNRLTELETAQQQRHRPNLENMGALLCEGWSDIYLELTRIERKTFWRMLLSEVRVYPDRHIEYDFL